MWTFMKAVIKLKQGSTREKNTEEKPKDGLITRIRRSIIPDDVEDVFSQLKKAKCKNTKRSEGFKDLKVCSRKDIIGKYDEDTVPRKKQNSLVTITNRPLRSGSLHGIWKIENDKTNDGRVKRLMVHRDSSVAIGKSMEALQSVQNCHERR